MHNIAPFNDVFVGVRQFVDAITFWCPLIIAGVILIVVLCFMSPAIFMAFDSWVSSPGKKANLRKRRQALSRRGR